MMINDALTKKLSLDIVRVFFICVLRLCNGLFFDFYVLGVYLIGVMRKTAK